MHQQNVCFELETANLGIIVIYLSYMSLFLLFISKESSYFNIFRYLLLIEMTDQNAFLYFHQELFLFANYIILYLKSMYKMYQFNISLIQMNIFIILIARFLVFKKIYKTLVVFGDCFWLWESTLFMFMRISLLKYKDVTNVVIFLVILLKLFYLGLNLRCLW